MFRIGYLFFFILFLISNSKAQTSIDHWESVVKAENNWRYFIGTSEPPAEWINKDFIDSTWPEGHGGFGYGDDDDGTIIIPVSSVYLRIKFTLNNFDQIEKAILLADYDDAYIAYLNGIEISRSGINGERPAYNQFANSLHEAGLYQDIYPFETIISKAELDEKFVVGENILAIQVHNADAASSDLSSNFCLNVAMNISTSIYQQTPDWFRPPMEFGSSNLPIIKVNTNGQYIPDEPKISATMGIIDNGNQNHIDDPFSGYDGNIGIEMRGSSSQGLFPKKQYAVELWTATGQDTSASILGLPAEEDWILYAPYSDKSLIRNVLTYKWGTDLGWYTPRTKLCELYLNDSYRGVYVLTEKIKRDKNRVDISSLNADEKSGDDLTGGYIVKIDKSTGNQTGDGWDSPYRPLKREKEQAIHFQYHYPKEDEIISEQSKYIRNYITEFERTLHGPFFRDKVDGYRKYIDVESFIDFAIINELTRNVDGYRLSTFLYKDKDSKDGKLHLGPLWDFNLALGNADYCEGGAMQGWAWDFNSKCNHDRFLIPFWWERLLRDPDYVIQFQNRWTELRNGPFRDDTIMNYIDSVATVLKEPQKRNFSRWPILSHYVWPNNYIGYTYVNEVNYLKKWIDDRLTWLDYNIAGLEAVTALEDELITKNNISIYPNPTNGKFSIQFSTFPDSDFKIEILNQLGEIVFDKSHNFNDLKDNTLSVFLDSNTLKSGLYFVNVSNERYLNYTGKLMVN